MICPSCGKKTIFDWSRCPACGVDPWRKPDSAIAATLPEADAASGVRLLAQRVLRVYTQRPRLSFVFVALGTLQIVVSTSVYVMSEHPAPTGPLWLIDWLLGLGMALVPGLLLLAVGEGLAYLAVISHARSRER